MVESLIEFAITHNAGWRGCHGGGAVVANDFTKHTMLICHGKQN
jgi:hypothetical protein